MRDQRIWQLVLGVTLVGRPGPAQEVRVHAVGQLDGGHVRTAGPVAGFTGGVRLQRGRTELTALASRFGVMTGCQSMYCDLRDAQSLEVGAGRGVGDASVWFVGLNAARVVERNDSPRALGAVYVARVWTPAPRLLVRVSGRIHVVPVRGFGVQAGWGIRAGLGVGRKARGG